MILYTVKEGIQPDQVVLTLHDVCKCYIDTRIYEFRSDYNNTATLRCYRCHQTLNLFSNIFLTYFKKLNSMIRLPTSESLVKHC